VYVYQKITQVPDSPAPSREYTTSLVSKFAEAGFVRHWFRKARRQPLMVGSWPSIVTLVPGKVAAAAAESGRGPGRGPPPATSRVHDKSTCSR